MLLSKLYDNLNKIDYKQRSLKVCAHTCVRDRNRDGNLNRQGPLLGK